MLATELDAIRAVYGRHSFAGEAFRRSQDRVVASPARPVGRANVVTVRPAPLFHFRTRRADWLKQKGTRFDSAGHLKC